MLIAAIVFGPFLMAFVSYGIGRRQENARDIFVILVTFLELLLSLLLIRGGHSLQITGILNGGLWLQNQGLHTVYSLVTSEPLLVLCPGDAGRHPGRHALFGSDDRLCLF